MNFTPEAKAFFPRTKALLELATRNEKNKIMDMPPGGVTLARLPAGLSIAPHCGITNARLRVSYGVKLPSRSCSIRVGNQTRDWLEGQAIILDDSFEHEVSGLQANKAN
jgi:aspartate beta-hydroxylase